MKATRSPYLLKISTAVLILLFVISLASLTYGNYRAGSGPADLATSALLLSIPLGLLYFSIGLLVLAVEQHRALGQVSSRLNAFLYWTPRVAGILITLFVAMFSLDVFSEPGSFWMQLGGFLIHSLPAIAMGILLALAWRRPVVGFVAFLLAAIFFLRFVAGSFSIVLLFSGPMAVIAALFWANWRWHIPRRLSSMTKTQDIR